MIDPELLYATAHKIRDNGKTVKVDRTVIFGDPNRIDHAIKVSKVSTRINAHFIERTKFNLEKSRQKVH